MLLALYLSATVAATDTSAAERTPAPAAAPAIQVHRQPSMPLLSLRLALLSDDPPGYAGAGHLIQHLVEPLLEDRLALVGGEARMERSSDAIVYTVTGPAAELGYLAESLRSVLDPPAVSPVQLLRAGQQLAEERLAEWETAGLHVRAGLRAQVFPSELPAAGTEASGRRLTDPTELAAAWALLYRPERVSITAVGDVRMREVAAAFGELPAASAAPEASSVGDEVTARALAPAEATRGWLGAAFPAEGLSPAVVTVAARLAGDALRERMPGGLVEAEHWWTHDGQALVLIVAAPRQALPQARSALGSALSDAAAALSGRRVAAAASALRREMLFYARTPDRMAEVLGRFSDRRGEPDAAQEFYAALDAVSARDVERVLEELMERVAITAEIPPQPLTGR